MHQASRLSYRSWSKFSIGKDEETIKSCIIKLDAWITSVVNSTEKMSKIKPHNDITTGKRHPKRVNWGRTVPIDSVRWFMALLPQAATQFYGKVLESLKDVISKSGHTFDDEIGVKKAGNREYRLEKRLRYFTVTFKYPINCRY